jgi:DNA modification methylase
MQTTILEGDCREQLRKLNAKSVHCCVTSPPYWGLRDYGLPPIQWPEMTYKPMAGMPGVTVPAMACALGLEPTPQAFVGHMVLVFHEVWRVLRDDGTLWLNLGDSYAGGGEVGRHDARDKKGVCAYSKFFGTDRQYTNRDHGLKPKDLCGIPWRVAMALQAEGWYLRSDIIWHKPNPMPESVTDRPTKAHEYIFLLTKSETYFFDAEAIKEEAAESSSDRAKYGWNGKMIFDESGKESFRSQPDPTEQMGPRWCPARRNKRSVWTVTTCSYPESHFATFPPKLIEPCILAGTSARGCCADCGAPWERVIEKRGGTWEDRKANGSPMRYGTENVGVLKTTRLGGSQSETTGWQPTCKCSCETSPCTVLDPFGGSGTTAMVAMEHGRKAIACEMNVEYVNLIRRRTAITPGLPLAL